MEETEVEEKAYLEIQLDKDKREVAAILVANGYCVCVESVATCKGKKKMLAFWKEKGNEK